MTDEVKSYKTAGALRAALEARLQARARSRHRSATLAPTGGIRSFPGAHFFQGTEGDLPVGTQGRLCNGIADSFRAHDQGY